MAGAGNPAGTGDPSSLIRDRGAVRAGSVEIRRRYHGEVAQVVTGLEVLMNDPAPLRGRSWGMLCNHASVTSELEPGRAALARVAGLPVRLFAPEHGIEGVAQDMESVEDQDDPLTGVPVRSLYGHDASSLEPRDEDLEGIDVLVVDLCDIGARYYTFAATVDAVMGACERRGVELVVADRPNPIGGMAREGGMVRPGYESFVGRIPVPIRHGLTLGEIALLLQRRRYPDLELTVILCRGWRREEWLDEAGLPWVAPSPNMPTLETAALYPGLCLVEATTLSEGRGTTRPFKLVGAPGLDARALAGALGQVPGVAVRPAWFRPEFGKHAGAVCSGVELAVVHRRRLRPVELGLRILDAVNRIDPGRFSWRDEAYEFVEEIPAIDLLTGDHRARRVIEEGAGLAELVEEWRREVGRFEECLPDILLIHDVTGSEHLRRCP